MSGPAKYGGADQSRIDLEAAQWQVRCSETALSSDEEQAFAQWLLRDIRNVEAFNAIERVRTSASNLVHLAYLLPSADVIPLPFKRKAVSTRIPWRSLSGIGAAAAAAVLAVVLLPILRQQMQAPALLNYETAVGESRTVQLEDGSTVTLGARSKVQVVFSPAERRVRLLEGEAFFDVVHLPDRIFVVEAGDAVIRDVGTKFDVNRAGADVQVAVLEGAVEVQTAVEPTVAKTPATVVRAGQKVDAVLRKTPGAAPLVAIAPVQITRETSASSWRDGRLVYENAPLADLVADLNRYYAPGISVSPEAADIRITASVRASEIAEFLSSLADMLPVTVAKATSGGFRIDVTAEKPGNASLSK